MKRKFIFLITLIFALGGVKSSLLNAQEVVVIGSGTEKNYSLPIETFRAKSASQTYYLSNEIGMPNGGTITTIAYQVAEQNGVNDRKLKVYLRNTEDSNFPRTGGKYYPVKMTSDDLVYDGETDLNTTGWVTIELSDGFQYDGANLLVTVYDNTNSKGDDTYFYLYPSGTNSDCKALYKNSASNSNPETITPGSTTWTFSGKSPNIQFTITPAGSSEPTPPTVTLTSPENNATDIFNPTLNFTLAKADSYELKFGTTNPPTETILSQSENIPSTVSYQPNLLNPNTTYYWQVSATNEDGTTTSDVYTFTTKEFDVPGAITNVSPEDNAQDLINPVLSWTFGENTEQQQVLIDENIVVDWTNIGTKTNDSYQTSNLAAGTHTWQVNTKNGAGEKTGTEYSFTVVSLPDNVTAISPANGATNVSSKIISWQFAENTTHYRVLMDLGNGGFEYVVGNGSNWVEVTSDITSFDASNEGLKTGTTYSWCVDVKNGIGTRGMYGCDEDVAVYSFTTGTILPVANTAPTNGAINLENPELQWNYNGTPEYYQVLMGTSENELEPKTEWLEAQGTSGTFQTENLNNVTKYYWRVNIKIGETVLEGEVWSFVTTLPMPINIAANPQNIIPSNNGYGSTTISWEAADDVQGYNVYLGNYETIEVEGAEEILVFEGDKLNTELIKTNQYTIEPSSLKLPYNMNPGYDIAVQAIYELGESDLSKTVNVKVTGLGNFSVTVQNPNYIALEGAKITLNGTNEFDEETIYQFTTDSNGVYTTIPDINNDNEDNEEEANKNPLLIGTYTMTVEKDSYNSYTGTVEIKRNEICSKTITLNSPNIFEVACMSDIDKVYIYLTSDDNQFTGGRFNVYYKKDGGDLTYLYENDFVLDGYMIVHHVDWNKWHNGKYEFGIEKPGTGIINWSNEIERDYNIFEEDGNLSDANNWRDGLPENGEDIYINAKATIGTEESLTFGDVTINTSGFLTIKGSLTANNVTNLNVNNLIINDGAQLRQNNTELKAKFVMNIANPESWSADKNVDGWQFLASPFTNAPISNFTNHSGEYDLYKYEGTNTGGEWVNQKQGNSDEEEEDNGDDNIIHGKQGGTKGFETAFVNSRGYLASYEKVNEDPSTATFSGTVNSTNAHNFIVEYTENGKWENFHLLGNPFTFDMDWNNVAQKNMIAGYAVLNDNGSGYKYATTGIIKVGDAFFVKTTGTNPTMSYQEAAKRSSNESINLIATGAEGSDNLIISLSGAENEGFNKLENFNEGIANIFIAKNDLRYGIANFDNDVTMIDVAFEAKEMGNYTIAAQPNGKFKTLTLVDRFTGIETDLLVEDYNFTATSNDNYNRFLVKLEANSQEPTVNGNFAYVSGEELILNIEGAVEIIDMMGRVVYSNEVESANNRLNVSELNNAAYIIRVVNEEGVKVQKVVIY